MLESLLDTVSSVLTPDQISELLHGAMKADFTAWSIKVALVWWLMSGKLKSVNDKVEAVRNDFATHFAKLELGLSKMVDQMKTLGDQLSQNTKDLQTVKDDQTKLTSRVEKLENNKGD